MANHDPDKEMFDALKESIKGISDTLNEWQRRESSIHSLAENSAKSSGAPAEQMDAHVYMHKKMIKKAMAEHMKQMEGGAEGKNSGEGGPGMRPQMPMMPQMPQGQMPQMPQMPMQAATRPPLTNPRG